MAKIGIGDRAPEFELEGTGGERLQARDLRGEWVVLAFYPGDFTPVCTRQFCSYRDAADRLDELDAVVLGISPQSVDSHERFTAEHGLTVPLLADPDHATAQAYGIVGPGRPRAPLDLHRRPRRRRPLPPRRPARPALPGRRAPGARAGARPRAPGVSPAGGSSRRSSTVARPGLTIAGEAAGEGPPVVLVHGLTATRRYVVHGSTALPRAGLRTISYDARGHGESDPAPADAGYAYAELAADLGGPARGAGAAEAAACSPVTRWAPTRSPRSRSRPRRGRRRVVVIGPASPESRADRGALAYWDRLADGLERGGVEGFVAAYDEGLDPEWRETLLRITRDRLSRHRHPEAVARALREVPRSLPFEGLEELEASRCRRSSSPATTRPTPATPTRSPRPGASGCPRRA